MNKWIRTGSFVKLMLILSIKLFFCLLGFSIAVSNFTPYVGTALKTGGGWIVVSIELNLLPAAASCVHNSRDPLSQAQPCSAWGTVQSTSQPIHLSTFKEAGGLFLKALSRHPLFGFLSGSALYLREAGLVESADCSLPQDCWVCLFEVITSDLGTRGLK